MLRSCIRVEKQRRNNTRLLRRETPLAEEKDKFKMVHICPHENCGAAFSRKRNRDRHYNLIHTQENMVYDCSICGGVFHSISELKEHRLEHEHSTGFKLLKSAFTKTCSIYRKTYSEKMPTLENSFQNDVKEMSEVLLHELSKKRVVKASLIFHAEFLKPLGGLGEDATKDVPYTVCLRTSSQQLHSKLDIPPFLSAARLGAQSRIDDFVENGSGWVLDEIYATDIELGACRALNGSCELLSVKYLKILKKVKNNPSNKRNTCFFDAVARHYVKTNDKKKLTEFAENNFNISIKTPVKVSDVAKFEGENSHLEDMAINILYAEEELVYPLAVSKKINASNSINLLLFKTLLGGKVISHYAYIEDIDSLVKQSYRGASGKLSYKKSFHCSNCLQHFSKRELKETHAAACMKNKPQRVIIPQEGDVLAFRNYRKKFLMPYWGFFDFEACQVKPEHECQKCQGGPCVHLTTLSSLQTALTFSTIIVESHSNKIIHRKTYSGYDCAKAIIEDLLDVEGDIKELMNAYPDHNLSEAEEKNFLFARVCHICEDDLGEDKVRDHCHTSGVYLGAAHNNCNLNRKTDCSIPMLCHNFTGYDSHFIMRALDANDRIESVEGLPYNTEKFRTVSFNSYNLVDSNSFLTASLDTLVKTLPIDYQYPLLDQMGLYDKNTAAGQELKKLLVRKGVYPYEHVTGLEMLRNTKSLPPIKHFYSSLTDSVVSEEDYRHAEKVFDAFGCENLLQYTEIYCATDVALLGEVMSCFRKVVMQNFGLDCW